MKCTHPVSWFHSALPNPCSGHRKTLKFRAVRRKSDPQRFNTHWIHVSGGTGMVPMKFWESETFGETQVRVDFSKLTDQPWKTVLDYLSFIPEAPHFSGDENLRRSDFYRKGRIFKVILVVWNRRYSFKWWWAPHCSRCWRKGWRICCQEKSSKLDGRLDSTLHYCFNRHSLMLLNFYYNNLSGILVANIPQVLCPKLTGTKTSLIVSSFTLETTGKAHTLARWQNKQSSLESSQVSPYSMNETFKFL